MERNLRTVKKAVKDYSNLLNNDKENAVKYCDDYIKDVNVLMMKVLMFLNIGVISVFRFSGGQRIIFLIRFIKA